MRSLFPLFCINVSYHVRRVRAMLFHTEVRSVFQNHAKSSKLHFFVENCGFFLIDFLFYILYIIYVVWIFKISDSYIALPPHPRAEETSRLLSMCFITENFLLSRTVVRSRYEWILEFTRSGPRKNVKYDAQQNRPLNTVFHANHTIFNTCLSSSVG